MANGLRKMFTSICLKKTLRLSEKPPRAIREWLWVSIKYSTTLRHLFCTLCRSVSKQPASRAPHWGLVWLGSIFRCLLTPFLAVVSTELVITPLASGLLNAKLWLVNKGVCLDSFYRLGLLNFNASRDWETLQLQGRGGKPSCVREQPCHQLFACSSTDKTSFLTLSLLHASSFCIMYCIDSKFDVCNLRGLTCKGPSLDRHHGHLYYI